MNGALTRGTHFAPGEEEVSPGIHRREQIAEGKVFPLSFSQQQLLYVCQFQSGSIAYNQPVAWRLIGQLNVEALEQSLNAIIRRHEALRTTFPAVGGREVQCVHHSLPLGVRRVDLRDLPHVARDARAHELLLEEARHPFDLAKELLLRAALFRTSDEQHQFVITVHHIVCDGWSMGILIEELTQFYRAFSSSATPPLQVAPFQYLDFSVSQREQLQGEKLDRQLAYWKQQLDGASQIDLPADHPCPPARTFRGASMPFTFPATLSSSFKALTAGEGVFVFMGLLAAWQTLLHRYTGETDLVVGAPVASRKRAKHQRSIGLFLNLVALRCDLSGDPTFRELLKRVRNVVMGAYQHQDLPFERVVKEVRPVRHPGRNPLFQVMLDQVDPRWIALDLAGVRADWFSVDNQTSKFDLTLAWAESPDGLRGWLEYNTDLYDAETITRLLGHYQAILKSAVADPDQRISRIPLLTQTERQQLLVEWNATEADYRDASIHNLFEHQVKRTPQAIAVATEKSQLTYEELNRRANQLAHHLSNGGVGKGSLVGVCLDRNCELVVALLAVLKAGGAYVPLDPAYPRQRLAFMVKDSGLKTLLTQERHTDRLPKDDVTTFCLDCEGERFAQESDENPSVETSPDDPAYLIYTSGSSGQPKGVVGLYRGAGNRFAWMWRNYPFEPGEVACAKTSLSFVDSIWEIFGPLLAGVPTVLVSEKVAKNPDNLISTLGRHRVTRLVLVPSLLRAMIENNPDIQKTLPHLKYCICSGEALSADLVARFRKGFPDAVLLNLYGSSEVSADVTCYDTRDMRPGDPVFAGRPIANTKIYILDQNLQPVPVGVTGQLCVSGHGLAQGYLARPEQTAEKFVTNPFHDGSRLYLTGDLARYRRDGNIELLGRMDQQIKIRGFRVELGEIESALQEHSSVDQSVVIARGLAHNDSKGPCRLIAYVVPHPASAELHDAMLPQLRQHLHEQLPDYMVPAHFVVLKCLPLTPSGKVDRRALPDPDAAQPDLTSNYVEPQTRFEHIIHEAWREVLQLEKVGTHDNFFDLGGHSLLLAAVYRKLTNAFNREIASTDLYQYPTISALAARLSDGDAEQRPLQQAQERARKQRETLLRRRENLAAKSQPPVDAR